jgi:hypothetical protein
VNQFWFTVKQFSFTVNEFSFTVKQFSFTVNEFSFTVKQFYFTIKQFSFTVNEFSFTVNAEVINGLGAGIAAESVAGTMGRFATVQPAGDLPLARRCQRCLHAKILQLTQRRLTITLDMPPSRLIVEVVSPGKTNRNSPSEKLCQ